MESDQDQEGAEGEKDVSTSDSDNENDKDEFHDSECNPLEQCDSNDEFMDPEFEELINSEGPQGMLQLMLQDRTDGIMTKENSDGDDYTDWIKWSSDAEENKSTECETARNVLGKVLLQQDKPDHGSVIPAIFQTTHARTEESNRKTKEGYVLGNHSESEIRWKEICERIKVDAELDEQGQ